MQDKRTKWKNQYQKIDSSSSFHENIRLIFTTDTFFKQLQCFQEVPLKALVPNYVNNLDAVDWYIDELNVVLELHGVQHYKMQSFGSKDSVYNQKKNFFNIKHRDNRKKTFLQNANFTYIEISYKLLSKIKKDPTFLKNLIIERVYNE